MLGVRVRMSEASKTVWGCFPAKVSRPLSLELRPDVVAMSHGEIYLASRSNILRYSQGLPRPPTFSSRRTLRAIGFRCLRIPCVEYL